MNELNHDAFLGSCLMEAANDESGTIGMMFYLWRAEQKWTELN
jgi:hypothetical protein